MSTSVDMVSDAEILVRDFLDLLAVPADRRRLADVGEGGRLVPGTPLPAPAGLFPRFVEPEAGIGA